MMGQRMDATHAFVLQTDINNVTGGASASRLRYCHSRLQDLILAGWRAGSFEAMIRLL